MLTYFLKNITDHIESYYHSYDSLACLNRIIGISFLAYIYYRHLNKHYYINQIMVYKYLLVVGSSLVFGVINDIYNGCDVYIIFTKLCEHSLIIFSSALLFTKIFPENCAICLDPPSFYMTTIECGRHFFCAQCVDLWIESGHRSCPVCRGK